MKSALYPKRLKILVPCYNCGSFIQECLRSIQNQTYPAWSVLVADDGSDDDTVEKVRPFLRDSRFTLRTNEDRMFLMGNIISGIRLLDPEPSDVIAIIDGDDLLRPSALNRIWQVHAQGYDLVYTDYDVDGEAFSIGRPIIPTIPIRQQLWCLSQLRSFKGYLFYGLDDSTFKDDKENYFRSAGDLSLLFPIAEKVGPYKIAFIQEKLYVYRVHDNCNHYVLREEQLANNWRLRSRPMLALQTDFFDFVEDRDHLEKFQLRELGQTVRQKHAMPFSVCVRHRVESHEVDSWRPYHNLWIDEGVFLKGMIGDKG
jgi:glycosyltransferase involved in cell wall biosynthesis